MLNVAVEMKTLTVLLLIYYGPLMFFFPSHFFMSYSVLIVNLIDIFWEFKLPNSSRYEYDSAGENNLWQWCGQRSLLSQQSQIFSWDSFMEDCFPWNWEVVGVVISGWSARYICWALYFYCYCINSTQVIKVLDPGDLRAYLQKVVVFWVVPERVASCKAKQEAC